MKIFKKSRWDSSKDALSIAVDFTKVDKERRLVSGYATLDNIDSQGDLVTPEASMKAFERARGNLREMHKKDSAVGKIVSFKDDTFKDANGTTYRGIFVTAYVSKGAQDTWEKVLDGTLTGFSIGGTINDSDEEWNKEANQNVRIVKDYDLIELSLVDNPANPLANVFSIQKQKDGSVTVKGMAVDTDVINVFYCEEDEIAKDTNDSSATCPLCNNDMKNIGWVEDYGNSEEEVAKTISKFLTGEEVEEMGKLAFSKVISTKTIDKGEPEPEKVGQPAEPVEVEPESETPDEVSGEEDKETVESVDEVQTDEEIITKMADEIKRMVETNIDQSKSDTKKQIEALEAIVKKLDTSFDEKFSQLEKKLSEVDQNLGMAKSQLASFEKRYDELNSRDAVRKSADVETAAATESKKTWNGAFSINNLV